MSTKNIVDNELYQRLLILVELLANNSQSQFAREIGLSQQTFYNYLNLDGQQKIRKTLLDRILMVYPQISRDWLYFGEGEMLAAPDATGQTSRNMETLQARVHELEAELAEERRLNRRLTETLLDAKK